MTAVSNLLICLNLGPVMKKSQGTGKSATAMKPRRLEAHPLPSLVYTIKKKISSEPENRRRILTLDREEGKCSRKSITGQTICTQGTGNG